MKKQIITSVAALAATLSPTPHLLAMDSTLPATGNCHYNTFIEAPMPPTPKTLSEELLAQIKEIKNPSQQLSPRSIQQKYIETSRRLNMISKTEKVDPSVYEQMNQIGQVLGLETLPNSSQSQSSPTSKKQSESKSTMLSKTLTDLLCCFPF